RSHVRNPSIHGQVLRLERHVRVPSVIERIGPAMFLPRLHEVVQPYEPIPPVVRVPQEQVAAELQVPLVECLVLGYLQLHGLVTTEALDLHEALCRDVVGCVADLAWHLGQVDRGPLQAEPGPAAWAHGLKGPLGLVAHRTKAVGERLVLERHHFTLCARIRRTCLSSANATRWSPSSVVLSRLSMSPCHNLSGSSSDASEMVMVCPLNV